MAEIQQQGGGDEGGKKRAKKGSTKVDMTPMVDLGFLLLTFFVMTTTLAKPQIMEINMPVKPKDREEQMELKASNAFTILLGADNGVYYYRGLHQPNVGIIPALEKSDWSAKGIRKVVAESIAANPNLVVLIKADETSSYKNLVDILDEMAITGTQKYAIVELDNADAGLLRKTEGGQ
ncbi:MULTISPECIES: ExbD/TolR family protein [Rufibacter]|uniref:Biopolymer transport protein ExbD n=1 Tax=Rufibacter quisquiliarum TaxID=1549639 RepID=A0A839GTJ1_9BACT|nr:MULTISPECIES: biopolymer transporter ExbD [Rufibacter]MBA9077728.1 biopolymer transport protein ExbD [Rufibacter quisquiliarum]